MSRRLKPSRLTEAKEPILLVRAGEELRLMRKPAWQAIAVDVQLIFLKAAMW